jgi:hypothetical protein
MYKVIQTEPTFEIEESEIPPKAMGCIGEIWIRK